ncbi:MAG TPA: signal peptidase I, partial [Trichocoleus sp.]
MTPPQSKIYVGKANQRSAWLAVNLGIVLPGLGHIYAGAIAKGVTVAIAVLSLLLFIAWSIFSGSGNTLTGLLLLLPTVALYLGSLLGAYRTLSSASEPLTLNQRGSKDPWYAVFLSQILPGLGHLYRQQAISGGLFLLAGIATAWGANFQPRLLPLPPLIWAAACIHLYLGMTPKRSRQWGLLALLLVGLVSSRLMLGSVPLLVRHSLEQCIVPSESMLPTLEVGDRLFVRQNSEYQPQLGDVVVFEAPTAAVTVLKTAPGSLMVKRVFGLPGQEIAVQAGQVWVDGQALAEPYLKSP